MFECTCRQAQEFANVLPTDNTFAQKISKGLCLGKVLITPWHCLHTDKPKILQNGNQVLIRKYEVWKTYQSMTVHCN